MPEVPLHGHRDVLDYGVSGAHPRRLRPLQRVGIAILVALVFVFVLYAVGLLTWGIWDLLKGYSS